MIPIDVADYETLAKTTAATTVVGGGILWTFREKISQWVKGQSAERFVRLESNVSKIDERLAARAISDATQSAQVTSLREEVKDGFARLTRAIERIEDRIDKDEP